MSAVSTVNVTVPATTANLGPGFDCIGVALTLYNQFKFTAVPNAATPLTIKVKGEEADRVDTNGDNLVYKTFLKLYQHLGLTPPPIEIEIVLGVPLARGLGSSATAIAGGLIGANSLAGSPLTQQEIMHIAIGIEGHPDNIVPAIMGGCRLAAVNDSPFTKEKNPWEICDIPWHNNIIPIVAIPDFELSTSESRRVLPTKYDRADSIFNTAHLGLLIRALETGRGEWLRIAMQDKIHQPYRKKLIPGYDAVREAAINAGSYGLVISGAGPTLLALADMTSSLAVEKAIATTWQQFGINAEVRSLKPDLQGTCISF